LLITYEEEGIAFTRKIGIPDEFPPNECIFSGHPTFPATILYYLLSIFGEQADSFTAFRLTQAARMQQKAAKGQKSQRHGEILLQQVIRYVQFFDILLFIRK
jgi:hypothetical protein